MMLTSSQTAVIKETLRVIGVLTSRSPLVSPSENLVYKDWIIPAGVRLNWPQKTVPLKLITLATDPREHDIPACPS